MSRKKSRGLLRQERKRRSRSAKALPNALTRPNHPREILVSLRDHVGIRQLPAQGQPCIPRTRNAMASRRRLGGAALLLLAAAWSAWTATPGIAPRPRAAGFFVPLPPRTPAAERQAVSEAPVPTSAVNCALPATVPIVFSSDQSFPSKFSPYSLGIRKF